MIKNHHRDFSLRWKVTFVSIAKGQWSQFSSSRSRRWLTRLLRGFGTVKVFRTWLKNQHAIMLCTSRMRRHGRRSIVPCFSNSMTSTGKSSNIIGRSNRFATSSIVRSANPPRFATIFCSDLWLCAIATIARQRRDCNCYRLKRELFNEIIAAFIQTFTPNLEHLNPQFQPPVNA